MANDNFTANHFLLQVYPGSKPVRVFRSGANIKCKECKVEFLQKTQNNVFCTPKCKRVWAWDHRFENSSANSKVCPTCNRAFIATRYWQTFCSKKCRSYAHVSPYGNSRPQQDESQASFVKRVKGYRRKIGKKWKNKNKAKGLCISCRNKSVTKKSSLCEYHWFFLLAHRYEFKPRAIAMKRLKQMLVDQKFKCAYTGKELVIGVNASIDHKNPRSRFPDQSRDLDNIEWIDLSVNRAKRAMTKDEFLEMCRTISSRFIVK